MNKERFEALLIELRTRGISEYYLTPGAKPFYRIEGVVGEDTGDERVSSAYTEAIMTFVLMENERDLLSKEGRYELAYSIAHVGRFRIRFGRQRSTITVTIMVKINDIPRVEDLNIPTGIINILDKEQGLLVLSGEIKSGKTKTAAAILKHISKMRSKIITTVENPIEYLLAHELGIVNQMEVGIDIESIDMGLNEAVNNYSDLIYVSEVAGINEFRHIFDALEKGFFMIICMNTSSVESGLNRILHSFKQEEQIHVRQLLANNLIGFINEQNIRTVTGGMRPVFEVLLNNDAVSKMLIENKLSQIGEIYKAYPGTGIKSMDMAIFDAVMSGEVDKDHALGLVRDPDAFIKRMNGVAK